MENLDQDTGAVTPPIEIPAPRLRITPEIRTYWQEIAGWALVFAGLSILYLIVTVIDTIGKFQNGLDPSIVTPGMGVGFIFVIVIISLLTFLPVWFYYKFASLVRRGIRNETNHDIEEGFSFFKYHYVFYGVVAILYMVFIALVFIIAIGVNIFRNVN